MPSAARLSRRHLLALLGGASASFIPRWPQREANAGRSWCRFNPIVRVSGVHIDGAQDVHPWVAVCRPSRRDAERPSRGAVEVERLDDRRGLGDGFAVKIRTEPGPTIGADIPLRFRVRIPFDEDARDWTDREALNEGPSASAPSATARTSGWSSSPADRQAGATTESGCRSRTEPATARD